jgi:hypothetical protein
MKPVVPRRGLVSEPFTSVDLDAFHRSSYNYGGGLDHPRGVQYGKFFGREAEPWGFFPLCAFGA